MHVVGVEDVKLDTEYKKRFLDAYFGGGEYYYHDLEHYTVDELNSYIDLKSRELNEMNSRDDVDDSTKQELVQQMEQDLSGYRDLLTDAKISYTIASDLQSCDEYAGYKGDTFCEVTFKEHWVNAYVFKLDGKYYGPPSFKEENYDNVSQTFQEDNLTDSAGADGNECTRSAAESKKLCRTLWESLDCQIRLSVESAIVTGWDLIMGMKTGRAAGTHCGDMCIRMEQALMDRFLRIVLIHQNVTLCFARMRKTLHWVTVFS